MYCSGFEWFGGVGRRLTKPHGPLIGKFIMCYLSQLNFYVQTLKYAYLNWYLVLTFSLDYSYFNLQSNVTVRDGAAVYNFLCTVSDWEFLQRFSFQSNSTSYSYIRPRNTWAGNTGLRHPWTFNTRFLYSQCRGYYSLRLDWRFRNRGSWHFLAAFLYFSTTKVQIVCD